LRYCVQTLFLTPFSVLYTVVGGKVVYQRKSVEAWHSGQLFEAMPIDG